VKEEDCPCVVDDQSYPPGTVIEVNCQKWYVCLATHQFSFQ